MYPLFSILLWLVIGVICSRIARQRGRNPTTWFFLGVILGVIGLIILYIIPSKKVSLVMASSTPTPSQQPIEITVSPVEHDSPPESPILWYYLDKTNEQHGPMSFQALQGAWDDDLITSSTYVWNEKMENWQTLEELPDLLAKIRRSPESWLRITEPFAKIDWSGVLQEALPRRNYQEALVIPGMSPALDISRKQRRESLNFLRYPRERPVSWQRLRRRTLEEFRESLLSASWAFKRSSMVADRLRTIFLSSFLFSHFMLTRRSRRFSFSIIAFLAITSYFFLAGPFCLCLRFGFLLLIT